MKKQYNKETMEEMLNRTYKELEKQFPNNPNLSLFKKMFDIILKKSAQEKQLSFEDGAKAGREKELNKILDLMHEFEGNGLEDVFSIISSYIDESLYEMKTGRRADEQY